MNNIVIPPDIVKNLPKITVKYIVFVFTHLTASYSYSKDIEDKVYFMDDPRLDDPDNVPGQKTYAKLFFQYLGEALEKGKALIELPYNPFTAFMFSLIKDKVERNKATNILAVSFFHTDHDVETRAGEYGKAALEIKFQVIESMIQYPFIKKIEIPIDEVVTGDFMRDLMREE